MISKREDSAHHSSIWIKQVEVEYMREYTKIYHQVNMAIRMKEILRECKTKWDNIKVEYKRILQGLSMESLVIEVVSKKIRWYKKKTTSLWKVVQKGSLKKYQINL